MRFPTFGLLLYTCLGYLVLAPSENDRGSTIAASATEPRHQSSRRHHALCSQPGKTRQVPSEPVARAEHGRFPCHGIKDSRDLVHSDRPETGDQADEVQVLERFRPCCDNAPEQRRLRASRPTGAAPAWPSKDFEGRDCRKIGV